MAATETGQLIYSAVASCGDGLRSRTSQRVACQPPALRAGNRLPLRALSQSRRVGADSRDIRHAAKNAGCTSSTENAMAELAAATSLSRFPCFALRAACAGGCPATRCAALLQRGRFLQRTGDYERRDTRSTKTPRRPCRPSPSNSRWEHLRSRDNSLRAAASVFPRPRIGDRSRKKRPRCMCRAVPSVRRRRYMLHFCSPTYVLTRTFTPSVSMVICPFRSVL